MSVLLMMSIASVYSLGVDLFESQLSIAKSGLKSKNKHF